MKIDAHQHFWQYNPDEYGWIDESISVLKKDHLPDDLAILLQAAGIDGTIAVQARQSHEETRWLLRLAKEYPFIRGVVGWVDLCSPIVIDQLEEFSHDPKFLGVRHMLQDEPEDTFMLRPCFLYGIEMLQYFDLTYDFVIFPKHLPVAANLAALFPEQPFVLDHIAKPFIKDQKITPWDIHIQKLAACKNVYCKISGIVTEADRQHWTMEDFIPYLDVVFDSFGTERIMIGSDWPVCTVAASYFDVMQIPLNYIKQFSEKEQRDICCENARRFYRFEK
ncbi:MAG: amidohydrolase [Candidatus Omnitrophota bacterium]|jgi:L-fuconolactonase|nr:MAG: amidohydrolase [Candidatus Omnitrophota bacterium]